MRDVWYLVDNLHIGYNEALDISVQEKIYLIECINDKIEQTNKAFTDATKNATIKK